MDGFFSMDSLFSNIGGKIKRAAEIVLILGIISGLVLGIYFGYDIWYDYYNQAHWDFNYPWRTAIIIIVSPIISYITSLFIYAVGNLLDDVESIKHGIYPTKNELSALSSKIESKEEQE